MAIATHDQEIRTATLGSVKQFAADVTGWPITYFPLLNFDVVPGEILDSGDRLTVIGPAVIIQTAAAFIRNGRLADGARTDSREPFHAIATALPHGTATASDLWQRLAGDCPNARSTAPNNRCAIYPQLANAIPDEQGGLSCRPKNLMVDNQFSRTVIVVPLGGTVKLNSSKLGLCMPSL